MKITVNFFGMFIEKNNGNSLGELEFHNQPVSLVDFKDTLLKQYSFLKNSSYVIAVNQQIATTDTTISVNDEIAVLPPFSGG